METKEHLLRIQAALILLEIPDYEPARDQLELALEENPGDPYIYLLLGKIEDQYSDSLDNSVLNYCKALAIDENFNEAQLELDEALSWFDEHYDSDEYPWFDQVLGEIQDLATRNPRNPWIQIAYAVFLSKLDDDDDKVLDVYERIYQFHPQHERLAIRYARFLRKSNDTETARSVLESAKEFAVSSEFYTLLGSILFAGENYQEALKSYERATALNPNPLDPWLWLALATYKTTGDLDQSLAILVDGIARNQEGWDESLAKFAIIQHIDHQQELAQICLELGYRAARNISGGGERFGMLMFGLWESSAADYPETRLQQIDTYLQANWINQYTRDKFVAEKNILLKEHNSEVETDR